MSLNELIYSNYVVISYTIRAIRMALKCDDAVFNSLLKLCPT